MSVSEIFGWVGSVLDMLGIRNVVAAGVILGLVVAFLRNFRK